MEFDIKPDPEGISVKPMTRTLLVPENVINLQFVERWPALISSDTNCSTSLSAVEHTNRRSHPRKRTWADGGSNSPSTFDSGRDQSPLGRHGEAEAWRRMSECRSSAGRTSSAFAQKTRLRQSSAVIRPDKINPIIDTLSTSALAGSWWRSHTHSHTSSFFKCFCSTHEAHYTSLNLRCMSSMSDWHLDES